MSAAYEVLPSAPGEHSVKLTRRRTQKLFTSGSRFLERLSPTPTSTPTPGSELDHADLEIEDNVPFLLDGLTKDDLGKIGWQRDNPLLIQPIKIEMAKAVVIDSPSTPPMTSIGRRFTICDTVPAPAPIDWLASLSASQPPSLTLSFSSSADSATIRSRRWSSLATESTLVEDRPRSSLQPLCEKQELYGKDPNKSSRRLTKRKTRPYGQSSSVEGKSIPKWRAKISGLLHLRA